MRRRVCVGTKEHPLRSRCFTCEHFCAIACTQRQSTREQLLRSIVVTLYAGVMHMSSIARADKNEQPDKQTRSAWPRVYILADWWLAVRRCLRESETAILSVACSPRGDRSSSGQASGMCTRSRKRRDTAHSFTSSRGDWQWRCTCASTCNSSSSIRSFNRIGLLVEASTKVMNEWMFASFDFSVSEHCLLQQIRPCYLPMFTLSYRCNQSSFVFCFQADARARIRQPQRTKEGERT